MASEDPGDAKNLWFRVVPKSGAGQRGLFRKTLIFLSTEYTDHRVSVHTACAKHKNPHLSSPFDGNTDLK